MAVSYSEIPMVSTTLAVTMGGNKKRILVKHRPTSMPTQAPAICAPTRPPIPDCSTMERRVGRKAKPLPTMTGRPLLMKPFTPKACSRMASAATSRLPCTMMI